MVSAFSAIRDLPVRRFGLFQAEPSFTGDQLRTIPKYSGLGEEDRFSRHLRQRKIALSQLLGHGCASEFGERSGKSRDGIGATHTVAATEPELLLLSGNG
jgi:hypothetical protein